MWISEEKVKKIAAQAKLNLREDEVPTLRQQLQDLLDHAGDVPIQGKIAIEAVNPLRASTEMSSSNNSPSLQQQEVLALAPDSEQGFIRVPQVLSND